MRQCRVFVQASSFQRLHVEQCEYQGVDPSCAFVAKTISFPDDMEPPADLLRAAEWAADAQANEKMAVDLKVSAAKGRAVIMGAGYCTFNGERKRIRYLVGFTEAQKWWWLAVNGASVAAAFVELTDPVVYLTPEQLIGYPTRESQLHYQKFLLEAPMEEVTKYMTQTVPDLIREGQLAYRRPKHPQPPTQGSTAWMERNDLDEQENE